MFCAHACTWNSNKKLCQPNKKKAREKKHNDFRVSAIIELTIAKSKHPGSNSDRPNTNLPRTSKPAWSNVNFMFFRYMIDHIENKWWGEGTDKKEKN